MIDPKGKKESPILWTPEAEEVIVKIREQVAGCPLLHFMDEEPPVELYTDASDYGIGGVLFQRVNGDSKSISFVSKLLSATQCKWSTIQNGLREDNPERALMSDLAEGVRVHLPEGFCPNGNQPQTPSRATYVSVAPAVNKMLGDIVEQKLAFILLFDLAKRHVPRMHLGKAHWTKKKGKPFGRQLGDLTLVDGTPLNTPETSAAAAAY